MHERLRTYKIMWRSNRWIQGHGDIRMAGDASIRLLVVGGMLGRINSTSEKLGELAWKQRAIAIEWRRGIAVHVAKLCLQSRCLYKDTATTGSVLRTDTPTSRATADVLIPAVRRRRCWCSDATRMQAGSCRGNYVQLQRHAQTHKHTREQSKRWCTYAGVNVLLGQTRRGRPCDFL